MTLPLLDTLHGAVDDLADAILVLAVVALALGLAHLLHDDLLAFCAATRPKSRRRQRLGDEDRLPWRRRSAPVRLPGGLRGDRFRPVDHRRDT